MRAIITIIGITALLSAFAGCCWGWHGAVVIKPNPKDMALSDFHVRGPGDAKAKLVFTSGQVCANHYHSAEYVNGVLYFIRRIGESGEIDINGKWRDELWRRDRGGKLSRIFSRKGLDFRVNDDGSLLAVSARRSDSDWRSDVFLLKPDGKPVKQFSPKQLGAHDLDFERHASVWRGRYLWLVDQEAVEIYGFIRIDSRSLKATRYAAPAGMLSTDYDLNPRSLRLAYSDYPAIFDTVGQEEFDKSKTPVHLYVRDLRTGRRRQIAKSIADGFDPEWSGARTLSYDRPGGSGRTTVSVR